MTPKQIINAWNAQADHTNQWGALGHNEMIEWTIKCVAGRGIESEKARHGHGQIPEVHFMRQTLAVAIAGLYEHHKADVLRAFALDDLQTVADLSESLRPQQVEDIYKRAWDLLECAERAIDASPSPWLPIESAPTDGTRFWGFREGRQAVAYRVPRDDCEMWCFGGSSGSVDTAPHLKPTHYMPLPADPEWV